MSDRLENALRELTHVEAPDGLAARVRNRLESGEVAPARWPRLAAAAALALVVVAGTWMAVRVDREREVRVGAALEGGAEAPPARTEAPPGGVRAGGAGVRAGGTGVRAGGTLVPPIRTQRPPLLSADHDRALPALSDIQPIVQTAVGPAALTMEAERLDALEPLVPITVPALGADEGERR